MFISEFVTTIQLYISMSFEILFCSQGHIVIFKFYSQVRMSREEHFLNVITFCTTRTSTCQPTTRWLTSTPTRSQYNETLTPLLTATQNKLERVLGESNIFD